MLGEVVACCGMRKECKKEQPSEAFGLEGCKVGDNLLSR